MSGGLHVKYFCPALLEIEFYRKVLEKYSDTKFHENPSSCNPVVPCGRTDGRDKANSRFSQFFESILCHFTKLISTFHTTTVWSNLRQPIFHSCSTNQARLAATVHLFCPQGE